MGQIRGFSWIAGFLAISVISACDDGKGPLAPTGPGGGPLISPAAIQGTVKNSAASPPANISSSIRTASGAIGMTVTVVGTNVGTVADSEGRFALTGVRPGPVQLQFTGAGVNAVLELGSVAPGETVNIVVSVDGPTAVLESETSDADPVEDDDSDDADDQEDDDSDTAEDDDSDDTDDQEDDDSDDGTDAADDEDDDQ